MWSLRDSSGCTNQPKHLSATGGPENHDESEDSEEHQALLQNGGFFSVFHIYWLKKSSANLAAHQVRKQYRHRGLVPVLISPSAGSALTGPPHKEAHFSLQRHLQTWVSNDHVSVGRMFLYCFISYCLILLPVFCVCVSDKAESQAPCAPLQCLQDKDRASYPSPGQDPSLDCHTFILVEDLFPKWKF